MNRSTVARALTAAITATVIAIAGLAVAAPANAATRTISGTVSLPAGFGSSALDAVDIYVYPAGSKNYTATASATESGTFSVTGLAAGPYNVCAYPGGYYQPEGIYPPKNVLGACFNTADYFGTRGIVDITASDVTGLQLALPFGRTISGKVTLPAGTPASWLGGVEVYSYYATDSGYVGNRARVNPSTGAYTVDGLYPGQYPVEFRGSSYTDPATGATVNPQFTSAYWGTDASGNPSVLDVRTSNVTGIDITLMPVENPSKFTVIPKPLISGSPVVGATLTAVTGTWNPAATNLTYQWRRNSTDIPGATNKTYLVTAQDIGTSITVVVTGSAPGVSSESAYSTWLSIQDTFTSAGPVTVTGTGKVGNTLTCSAGTWTPTPDELRYFWYRGNLGVSETSSQTYTVSAGDAGALLYCKVLGVRGDRTVSLSSPGVSVPQIFTAAGTIAISGSNAIGETLTASTSGTSPASDEVAYMWLRNGTAIPGATSATYVLTPADSEATIRVTGEVRRVGYVSVNATAAQRVMPKFFAAAPVPTITGATAKGSTLTAVTGVWSPTPTFSYQWLRGGNAIAGATSATYALTAADGGYPLTVRVTGARSGYVTQINTSAALQIPNYWTTTPIPTISGTAKQGETLIVNTGTWGPGYATLSKQWLRDGSPISGATNVAYTLTADDAARAISVRVTAVGDGYSTESRTAVAVTVIGRFTAAPNPTITGETARGSTLTAVAGTWAPAATFTYQWLRNGSDIAGATGSTYVLSADDGGKQITVRVTGTRSGFEPSTRTSASAITVPSYFTTAPTPTVSGTHSVGQQIGVTSGTWSPTPTTLSIQWLRNGTPIAGATGETYTLGASDGGQQISARITAARSGYETEAKTSTPKAVSKLFEAAPQPAITGDSALGSVLTAAPGAWTPSASFAYQWLRNGTAVVDATDPTYALRLADAGASISVRVTGSADGYATTDRVSNVFAVPLYFTWAPTPVIAGVAKPGSTLTVTAGAWAPTPDNVSYQWLRNGEPIDGANTASYLLTTVDGGQALSVRATASKASYANRSATSTAVAVAGGFVTKVPTVTGTLRAGYSLKATVGAWTPAATSYSFQWYRNGAPIAKAIASSYKLTTTDRGKKITVKVTGKRAGYTTASATSVAKTVLYEFSKKPTPTITGTGKAGKTLTAHRGTWSPTPAYSYQWYRNGAKIAGATKYQYKVSTKDKGKKITVKVTGKKTGYATTTKTSASKSIAR